MLHETQRLKVNFYTGAGKEFLSKTFDLSSGKQCLTIPISGIPQGTIFYRIEVGDDLWNGKFLSL